MDLTKLTFGLQPAAGKGAVPFASDEALFEAQQDPRYSASTPEGDSYRAGFQQRLFATETARRQERERANAERTAHLKRLTPFADGNELTSAMQDPRYKTSETYRQEILDRVAAAQIHRNAAEASASLAVRRAVSPAASPAASSESNGPRPWRSAFERQQAYASPEYARNPDYRADVAARESVTGDLTDA